ncbi:MAG: biotin--[acetyl-CoA-carboxylase] ligase [Phycisphaeraceae bacterium]
MSPAVPGDIELLGYLLRCDPMDAGLARYDLGIEPNQLKRAIVRLTGLGCEIEEVAPHRYRLSRTPIELWSDYLESLISKHNLSPTQFRVFRSTNSTQTQAKVYAPSRTLVLADQQNAGKGRLGRTWVSKPGSSVLMSLCLPSEPKNPTHDRLSMLTGIAAAMAVERLLPDRSIRLKWPNDVMIDARKVAGIIIEKTANAFVIGIGINVLPDACRDPAIAQRATCLADHGCRSDRLYVVEQVFIELDRVLRLSDQALMLDEWRARASLGHIQSFEQAGQRITGEVLDLDPDHGLIVRRDTGEIVTLPAATTSVVA